MADPNVVLANCPYCDGFGVVCGNADDVSLEFQCVCQGGQEAAVRWLLGCQPSPGEEAA